MNENAKTWVAALRSGKYEQGIGFLRRHNNTYCCLGVACDLHAKQCGTEWVEDDHEDAFCCGGEAEAPPEEIRLWLGLRSSIGMYGCFSLTCLNDEGGNNFRDIADLIESEPEGLFE